MDALTLMVEEHNNIERMLKVIRKVCLKIMNENEIDYEDFEMIIDFVKNYADNHHHGKEEKLLFTKMIEEIGGAAEKLVRFGMLVEHDLGRLYIKELEELINDVKKGDNEAKLDIIANAVSYSNLLLRHIGKENNVAYPLAKRNLSKDTLNKLNIECNDFENKMKENKVQDKYIKILTLLEKKYR